MKVGADNKVQQFQMSMDAAFVNIEVNVENGSKAIAFQRALLDAAVWVNTGRTMFKMTEAAGEMIAGRWDTHPDRKVIESWLSARGAESDFYTLYFVSAHVISEWLRLPKRTLKEHRKLFGDIEATAQKLIGLLTETEEMYYRGGGYGLRHALVCDLFNDRETSDIVAAVESWNESHPEVMDDGTEVMRNPREMFPDMEDLLGRLVSAAKRIAKTGPIHSQPNKRGAINGFFVRRMEGLLRQRYGEAPAEVLAAIATIALDVVMDDDLAKKNSKLSERSKQK